VRTAARVVLSGELFVVLFAGLVARAQSDVSGYTVLWVCLAVVVLLIAAMATLKRGLLGYVLGSLVQVALLASTVWIHLMSVVGAVFTGLWLVALIQGKRADEMRAFAIESAERLNRTADPSTTQSADGPPSDG
jgi:hypothetical protein